MQVYSIFHDFRDHNLIFIAAFHLGVPLAICQTDKSREWKELRSELEKIFPKGNSVLYTVNMNFGQETNFPLGEPLILKHEHFLTVFDMLRFFQEEEGILINNDDCIIDHVIWVCPSGSVLFLVQMSFNDPQLITYQQFSGVVENHYAELSYLFSEVAEIILSFIKERAITPLFLCETDINKINKTINCRKGGSRDLKMTKNIVPFLATS